MSGTSRVIEIMRGARWFCDHNIKKGDNTVVVTDPKVAQDIPLAFAAAAASVGARVVTVFMPPPSAPAEEPPKLVADIMKSADVAISCASETLNFTKAAAACMRAGGIHLSVPGANVETLIRGTVEVFFDENEFQKMRSRALWLKDMLTKADQIRFTSENGTDIKASIKGRLPVPSYGQAEGDYRAASFPTGEVMLAPIEGTAEGVYVVDASMGGIGKIQTPITIVAKGGRIEDIKGKDEADKLRALVANSGKGADNIAEFGIGLNHMGLVTGNKNEDKRIAGSAHIALGNNCFIGNVPEGTSGTVDAKYHLDGVISRATVYLDGEKIVENGTLLF